MQNTNYDNSSIIKRVEYEHDYSLSERCIPKLEDCKENVFRKKFSRGFGLADKWTDRLLMHFVTGGDWNKIIDRETAILKIQYPFLPEQQLRGKAYKKFGIPAVMGGVVSRATAIFQGKVIPKELQKSNKKDRKMSLSQEVGKLESISELSSIDNQYLQRALKFKVKRKNSVENKDPPIIESPAKTQKKSVISDESETPTPDFEFHDENLQLSNYSQLTQFSKLDTQLRKSDDNIEIYSAPTQLVTPNLELLDNQAVNNVRLGEIANNFEISQIVSPAEIPTQLSTEKDFFYTDLNKNFILSKNFPSRKRKASQSPFSSPKTSTTPVKSATATQISLPFNTVDLDDCSQLPTPGIGNFTLNNVDHDYTFTGCKKMSNFLPEFNSHQILTNKIVSNEPECLITKSNLKRKRLTNIRTTENKENEENFRATTNNRETKAESVNMDFNSNSKSVLKPSCLNNTLNLMSPTRQVNLNFSCDKSESSSPDIAPPKRKKRRLEFRDSVSTTFMPKDCELTSLYPRDEKKQVRTLEPSDEIEDQEVFIVLEVKKNSTAESSVILGDNLEKKSSLKSNISSSAFMTKHCGLTPFYPRDKKNEVQTVDLSDKVDDEEVFIVAKIKKNSPAESSAILGAKLEKKSSLKSNISSSAFMTKDCGLTPFYPRDEKKKVQIVEPSDKDDDIGDQDKENDAFNSEEKTIDDKIERNPTGVLSKVLPDKQKEKSSLQSPTSLSILPIKNRELTPFYLNDRMKKVKIFDAGKENDASSSRKMLVFEKTTKSQTTESLKILPDNHQEKTSLQSPISCGLTPFHPRDTKKKVRMVEADKENDSSISREIVIIDEIESNASKESATVFPDKQEDTLSPEMPASRRINQVYARYRKNKIQTIENHKEDDNSSSQKILFSAEIDQDEIPVLKSTIGEKVGAIDIDDVCEGKQIVESSAVDLPDDHEEKSLLTSSTTHLSGSTASVTESLSNSQYNSSFSIDSRLFSGLDENIIGKTNLRNSFSAFLAVIHKQVEDILKFLDTDIKDD